MKKYVSCVLRHIGLFVITIIGIYLLLVLTYAMPNGQIRTHIQESVSTIVEEGLSTHPLYGNEDANNIEIVNVEARFLNMALRQNNEESPFVQAIRNTWYQVDDAHQLESLQIKANDKTVVDNREYLRYWEALEIFIRPLLQFFNYYQIKYFVSIVMITLLVITSINISGVLGIGYGVALPISFMCIQYVIVANSFIYSAVYAIMMINILYIIHSYKAQDETWIGKLSYVFVLTGVLTGCFDKLTTPIITLGVPLIIITLLLEKNPEWKLNKSIYSIIRYSLIWVLSYGMSFITKFLIASIILNKNVFAEGIDSILYRTTGDTGYGVDVFWFRSLEWNIRHMFYPVLKGVYFVIVVLWIVLLLYNIIKKKRITGFSLKMLPIFMIGIYPYIWYSVFQNHSIVHEWMTFRAQMITLFGLMAIMVMSLQPKTDCLISSSNQHNKS